MGRTVAIVPAAGSGERLAAGVAEAFVSLSGQALVERVIAGLRESGVVEDVVVAVPPAFKITTPLDLPLAEAVLTHEAHR